MPRKLTICYFLHSVRSDWNNGNAHFQRGLLRALGRLGHSVTCLERESGWSIDRLFEEEQAERSLSQFSAAYPDLQLQLYSLEDDSLRERLCEADVAIVHEWSPPELVERVLALRDELHFRALFHDTHHRASSNPEQMTELQVARFDGVLAFGEALRRIYLDRFGIRRVWTFHEAADTTVFHPKDSAKATDVVWIGNWGDGERSRELEEYLIGPAAQLPRFSFAVHGVRYPPNGLDSLSEAGIQFRGYLPNLEAPAVYAASQLTLHIPRQQYREAMAGTPTIRVFEALAAGIPLISAPWQDTEHLFCPGDFTMVSDGREMAAAIAFLIENPAAARESANRGLRTIRARHTCAHRAEQLTHICEEVLAG